jgi:hypothetical protein
MKKSVLLPLTAALVLLSNQSFATPVLSDNFNSYPNGNLTNGTTWFQTAPAANPVQVNGGVVTIGNSGQDVYSPFSSPVTLADGQSIYFGITLNVSAAGTGDYFMHFTPTAGNGSSFYDRLFVEATTGGYFLGLAGTSGGTTTYGTTVLSLGTSYNMVLAYNYSATTPTNSTDAIYINPSSPTVGNNTPYLLAAWGTATIDTNQIAAVNFRQGGGAAAAPTETVDNLVVSESFADVVAAPEPSTLALAAMGGAACLAAFRRRR